MSHYLRVSRGKLSLVNHKFKKSKMVIWNSFTDKIIVISQTRWFWAKTTFIQAICHKLEKCWADSYQDYPNAIHFNLVHLCPFMLLFCFAVLLLCCSTVLNGYCNVSFYFLGIFGVMKLHHFAWRSPFKIYRKQCLYLGLIYFAIF